MENSDNVERMIQRYINEVRSELSKTQRQVDDVSVAVRGNEWGWQGILGRMDRMESKLVVVQDTQDELKRDRDVANKVEERRQRIHKWIFWVLGGALMALLGSILFLVFQVAAGVGGV